jgi:malonyl-CoA/methylmalonyl-CoA synthetase
MMSFLDRLDENTQTLPGKLALEFVDPPLQRVTYGELDAAVLKAMTTLVSLGVGPGDRVALQLPKSKCLEFVVLHLATMRLGAITLPLNPAYPPAELAYLLDDSEARLFFADEDSRERIEPMLDARPALDRCVFLDYRTPSQFDALIESASGEPIPEPFAHRPDTTVLMIYTSGTTGRPKGAQITAGNLTSNLDALHTAWGWREDDVLLHALPVFHLHGLVVALHGALHAGASALALRKFDARRVLDTLVMRECSMFMGVPAIYQRILALPDATDYDLSGMRLLTSGSDRLPDELFLGFRETFGHTLLERYGMTETGMNISNPLDGERRMGSVGLPLPGVEARIVDPDSEAALPDGEVGAVQVRGPNVFRGYWRQPQKTADAFTPDGWLRTGDLGLREPDGYFTLKGRAKDLIISGGLNVYPSEVERVLSEHDAVAASVVFGCPDPAWGERVVAAVVVEPGEAATGDDLIGFCRERLAAYKCPKAVVLVESLPRNAMGKVLKGELRQEFC